MEDDSSLSSSSSSSLALSIKLYSYWESSCSWRVRFALKLKGLPYEYKPVDLRKGEQLSPEFEKISPLQYVPVLVDDGVVVSDSLAILMYLEDKYPQNQLLPTDPRRRAVNLQGSIEKKLGKEECLAWAQQVIEKGFTALEKLLKDCAGSYSTGDEVSMADVFLAPQISVAISRFQIAMSKFPTLSKIHESCKALPAFQASLPEKQPDYPDPARSTIA
ncbi:hypothetical protein Cgig2_033345 [Carnegiea gigantea]|uniref:glutathione transferase n=1 Tax=Carnegiea gigantea TaxID=171969 RepID=A0A9Q1QQN5_9CARY|nr:hypothetical protein Cgig2_033345 [Carnegiea gigantea]